MDLTLSASLRKSVGSKSLLAPRSRKLTGALFLLAAGRHPSLPHKQASNPVQLRGFSNQISVHSDSGLIPFRSSPRGDCTEALLTVTDAGSLDLWRLAGSLRTIQRNAALPMDQTTNNRADCNGADPVPVKVQYGAEVEVLGVAHFQALAMTGNDYADAGAREDRAF